MNTLYINSYSQFSLKVPCDFPLSRSSQEEVREEVFYKAASASKMAREGGFEAQINPNEKGYIGRNRLLKRI